MLDPWNCISKYWFGIWTSKMIILKIGFVLFLQMFYGSPKLKKVLHESRWKLHVTPKSLKLRFSKIAAFLIQLFQM